MVGPSHCFLCGQLGHGLSALIWDHPKCAGHERAEVDRSYVSILERGLKSPTLETLERICIALETLPERVLEEARKVKR